MLPAAAVAGGEGSVPWYCPATARSAARATTGAIAQAPVSTAGLADLVLQRLALLIPCEVVSFCDFDPATEITYLVQDCVDTTVATTIGTAPVPGDTFFRYFWTTPVCSYPSRTGDYRSVIMRTDFTSDRQWRNSPIYQEKFRADGLDHNMLCCAHTDGTRTQRVIFFRSGKPFSERERLLLSLLRPHLAEAFPPNRRRAGCHSPSGNRNCCAWSQPASATPRSRPACTCPRTRSENTWRTSTNACTWLHAPPPSPAPFPNCSHRPAPRLLARREVERLRTTV
jgi:hypothetical protein